MTRRMHRKAYRSSPTPSMFDMMHGSQGSAHQAGRVFSGGKYPPGVNSPDLKDPFDRSKTPKTPKTPKDKSRGVNSPDLKDPFKRSAARNPSLTYQQPRSVRPLPSQHPGMQMAYPAPSHSSGIHLARPSRVPEPSPRPSKADKVKRRSRRARRKLR